MDGDSNAGKAHDDAEQVFIDYGESGWRSSWEMLYTYGFVPGSKLEEWLASGGRPICFPAVSPTDPLMPQKRAVLVALGVEEGGEEEIWVDVKAKLDQITAMGPILRLAHLSAETAPELAKELASWSANPDSFWDAMQQQVNPEIERRVATQVVGACDEAMATLPSIEKLATDAAPPRADAAAPSPSEMRACLAARVLLGERHAVEACRSHWQRVLDGIAESS